MVAAPPRNGHRSKHGGELPRRPETVYGELPTQRKLDKSKYMRRSVCSPRARGTARRRTTWTDGDASVVDSRRPELKKTANFFRSRASQHARVDEEDEAATAELPGYLEHLGEVGIDGNRRRPDELGFRPDRNREHGRERDEYGEEENDADVSVVLSSRASRQGGGGTAASSSAFWREEEEERKENAIF